MNLIFILCGKINLQITKIKWHVTIFTHLYTPFTES